MRGKQVIAIILSVIMMLPSFTPMAAYAEDLPAGNRLALLKVEAEKDHPYDVLEIAVPSEEEPEAYVWGSGIKEDKKVLDKIGTPEDLTETLENIRDEKEPDKLITDLTKEWADYFDRSSALEPVKEKEDKYELSEGLYLISDEEGFYIPEFLEVKDKDLKITLEKQEKAEDIKSSDEQAEEPDSTEEPAEKEDSEAKDNTSDSKASAPAVKENAKAPSLKSADNEWIERFTATFIRGAEEESGKLIWTPTNANADHRFVYRVNYAFSGEFELPAGAVEIRVPKQILKNRDGEYDDYYDIAIPKEEEADSDTKFIYEEDGNELVIRNYTEVSAGESGTIEVSYLTKDKTFYYMDMEAHDPFYADIEVDNSGQKVTAHADAAPVHINTNSVIVRTDKRVPTLYRRWDASWGETPADADDYYFIRWEVRTAIKKENTQPYDFTLEDTFDDGEVVGYKFEGQNTYTQNNTVPNVYQRSDERYDYVLTKHLKSEFKDLQNYTVWNNITATVHPVDLLDPDTQATDREPFYYEKPVYRYPPGRFYADKFGQYTDTYTTGFEPSNYGIVQDSEDISDYGLDEFVLGDSDKLNDEHLKYYAYLRGYPYPWTLPDGEIGDDPYQYGKEPVKYELWDETINIEDNEPLVGGEDYEFSQLHFIFNFEKAVFNEETMQFDTSAATASDFTEDNNVIFYAKKVGDEEYVKIGEFAPGTNTWSNVNSSYVNRVEPNDIYFKSDVIGYKLETSNALWYTCLRVYPHLTLFRNEKTLSQMGDATTVRIDNTAYIQVTDHNGNELFPGDAENSKGEAYQEGMVNSDYVRKVLRQSNIQKYVTGTRNNKAKKTYTVTWRINMEESYTDNLGRHQIEQGGGTFFDLCPLGSHADKKSVIVYDNGTRLNSSNYDVSIEPNYNDTGRDLLVIKIKKPGKKYSFYYDTIHEWEDLSQVNFKIFNSVAYETENSRIAEGYPDDGGVGRDKALLADLDPDSDASRFIYSQDWHDVDLVVSTSTGINKKVRAEEDEKYSYDTMTYVNGNYSYRWRVANDEITKLKDMVLFDSMENFTKESENIESDWHGYVQSVDTAMLREQGIFPVVYYSSLENMDIYEHHNLDEMIDGEKVWKTKAEFGDISNAKAIAIDCSKALDGTDFVLGQGESIETFVNMKAPSQGMNLGRIPYSYNNIFLSSTKIDDLDQEHPDLIHQDYTKIGYKVKGDIDFYKVDKKDHENRISGIAFMLYGKSDYGTDVELEAVSDSNGYVRFNDVEQGTYQIRELGGSADWQVDRELKTVTIDKDGVATIDGLSKDGLVNRYYVWENEARIHADMDFIKKSANRPSEELSVISAIRGVRPGSTETVTIDGNEYYVLASDNDEALLMAKDAETSLSSFTGWNDSAIRTYLNGDYFNDKPILSALNVKHAVKTRRPESFENYTSTDEKAFILTQADISGFTGDEDASIDDYSAKQTILPNSILRSLSGTFVLRNPYSEGEAAVCNASTGEISAESSVLMPKFYPVIKVDIGDRINVTIPDTEFTVSGTSDYGNEVYETAVTNNSGKLVIRNLEQGTYQLIETRANEDYVPNSTEYTVIVDKNGLVSIFNGNEPVETNGSSYIIRNYPKYHSFSILKTDKENGQWLQGATFHLYGTSDIGTPVDITGTTGTNGRVEFANLEAGTYLIKETAAPDKHMIDPVSHVLTIQDNGMISISGINKENGTFDWRNERAYDGKIVITKIWKDNKEDNERPTPKVTIKTEKPASALQAYAVFDSSTGTLTFFRDEPGKYTGIKTFGTKTVYATDFETAAPSGPYSLPWDSKRDRINSVVVEDPIMPLSTAHWFEYCSNLTSADLALLDTSNVTTMSSMFRGCSNLTSFDGSGWDTSKVTDMYYMFSECYRLSDLSINDWDVGNVTNMNYMFNYCGRSASVPGALDLSNWDPKKLTNMDRMFYTCGFASVDMSGWELDSLTSIDDLFVYSEKLQTANLSGWTANNLTSLNDLFYYCYALRSVDASNWEMHNLTNVSRLITSCYAFTSLDVSGWDAGNITNMQQMFQYCSGLTSLDLSGIDTSNVTNMSSMFSQCTKLASLDLSGWDTSKVTNMSSMFSECYALEDFDVSGLDTSNVTDMSYMFHVCDALTSLDLSGWDTSSVTNMRGMFYGCSSLKNIYVSELWDTLAVTNSSNMFSSCSELPNFNSSVIDKTNAHYNEGGYLTYKAAPSGSSGANMIPMMLLMKKLGVTGLIEKALVKLGILQEAYAAEDTAVLTFESGTDGTFEDGSTTNVVEYELLYPTLIKYSHTPNMGDDGVATRLITSSEGNTTDTVIIPGAAKIEIDVWYSTYSTSYSWLAIYGKNQTPSTINYASAAISKGKLGGGGSYNSYAKPTSSSYHKTYTVNDDTVKFYFRRGGTTISYLSGYGYYAVVTGYDSDGNPIRETSGEKILGNIISGEYKEPVARDPEYRFDDWTPSLSSITSDATITATYEEDLLSDQTKGVYDGVDWKIKGDGTLVIGKAGETQSFANNPDRTYSSWPWYQYRSQIKNVEFAGPVNGNGSHNGMFYNCSQLIDFDTTNFNTSNVTNMSYMFQGCSKLTSLDVSGWDTGSVTNMSYMFNYCNKLTSLGVSGWDTGSVTNMSNMFGNCSSLTSLDVSEWDTGNVTNMSNMFQSCSALEDFDVSCFDTSKVTDMGYMFQNCSGLTSLNVSNFDTSNVQSMSNMFSGCSGLTSLDFSSFDTSNVTNMQNMFAGCSGLTSLDLSSFDTSKVTNMSSMFYNCSRLTRLDVSGWDTSKVTTFYGMFQNCNALTSLDVSDWDTSNVTTMSSMFQNCSALTSLDVSGFDTSRVYGMNSMFQNCSGLTSLDVSGFDTSKVEGMGSMFSGCTSLRSVDISGFTTNTLFSVDHLFENCSSLTSLDLSHFDLLNNTNVTSMLKGCDSLEKIVLGPGLNTASGRGNTQVELPGNWQRVANLNGRKLSEPGPLLTSEELFSTYDGFDDNGIYLKEGVDDQQYDIKDNEAYTSVDENWVKNGDGTWTYTFNVYDDEAEFYGFEDLMNGYDVEYDENNQFIINEDGSVTKSITITNTSTDTASLSVTKTVNGNNLKPTDTSREFEFKITLTNENASLFAGVKEYGGVVYKDGVAVFKLKHGDTMNFTKLPLDTSYVIEETPVDGFNSTITNSEGLLENTDVVNVQAVNTKTDVELRNITIAKTIEGAISENEEFSYRVVLKGLEAKSEYTMYNSATGETETITSDALGAATAEFTLKGGKNAVFSNLPVGATYTVTENGGNYVPSYTVADANEQGTIAKASDSETEGQSLATAKETVNTGEDVTVTFTNKRTVTQDDTIDITLLKKAQGSDEVLGGATFNLSGTSENQEDIDITTVSDSDGKLTFRKIENGTYQLKETKAPAGYSLDQTVYTVTVQNGTAEITGLTRVDGNFVVYNTPVPTADFSFRKTDSASGTPLSGARFSISDGSTVVGRKASDDNGIVSFEGLEFKTYTLREIEAPEGYELSDEEYTVTLTSGSPATVEITDSSGDPVQKDGDTYVISNTRKTVVFTLKKNVAGGMGDHVNPFVFSYILTDAAANATYTATNGAETIEIATDSTGSATGTLHLSDGGNFHIEGLPSGAKIITTETANDHTASYSAAVGRYSMEGQNETFNTALSTEELSLTDSATVTFTNVRTALTPTGIKKVSEHLMLAVFALAGALYALLRARRTRKASDMKE